MMYLLEKDEKSEFENGLVYLQDELMTDDGIVAMGKEDTMIERFSTYDQLKLFRLLYKASNKWDEQAYAVICERIEEHLYNHYIKENIVYPYYKTQENLGIDAPLPLYFLDLNSLALLGNYRISWIQAYNESKELIQRAYISDVFPFYHTKYDYEEHNYNSEYKANMLDTLLIVLNLAEVDLAKPTTITWLKSELKKGAVYETYDKTTGHALDSVEKASIYGVIGQIGKVTGDLELYTLAIEKMLRLQNKDEESDFLGCFEVEDEQVSIYENLNALLAF